MSGYPAWFARDMKKGPIRSRHCEQPRCLESARRWKGHLCVLGGYVKRRAIACDCGTNCLSSMVVYAPVMMKFAFSGFERGVVTKNGFCRVGQWVRWTIFIRKDCCR